MSSGDLAYTRNGSLERADLDGGNRVTIVSRAAFTTGKQLTADFDEGVLYWCDREGMQVLSCNLDGSDLRALVVTAVGEEAAHIDRNHCVGIAVDLHRRLLYWTQKGAPNAGEGRIFRAPLDLPPGTSAAHRDDIELLFKDLPEPIDLHLLGDGATLVWTDRGDEPEGNTLNRATVVPTIGAPEILSTDTGRRSGWPRSPTASSTSAISPAASATSTSTAALTPNWCTSATASPASRLPKSEQRKCLIINRCWCART